MSQNNGTQAWFLIQASTFLNLVCGMLIARRLVPYEFGKFYSVLASMAIIVSVINPVASEISRLVAKFDGVSKKVLKQVALLTLIVLSVALGLLVFGLEYVSFESLCWIVLAFIFLTGTTLIGAVLNGQGKVEVFGINQFVSAVVKTIYIYFIIEHSSSYIQAIIGYLIGFLFFVALSLKEKVFFVSSKDEEIRLSRTVLAGFFLLALPFAMDQLLVHRFHIEFSGQYAAIASYGKVIMLASVSGLVISYAKMLKVRSAVEFTEQIKKQISFIFIFAIGLVLFFLLTKQFLFPLLLGNQYKDLVPYVAPMVVGVGFHVGAYYLFQTLLSFSYKLTLPFLVLPCIFQGVFVALFQDYNLPGLVNIVAASYFLQFICAAICAGTFVYQVKNNKVQLDGSR